MLYICIYKHSPVYQVYLCDDMFSRGYDEAVTHRYRNRSRYLDIDIDI